MSFLDRLVGDLLGNATGLPIKGLVRKVGAKNLLLLGGMAAAGGYAAHTISQGRRQPATAPPPGALPPLPPAPQRAAAGSGVTPPASSPLPPLPPIPTGPAPPGLATPDQRSEVSGSELPDHLQLAIVRTMVAAALADGRMAPEERAAIQSHLGEAGLRPEDVARVHQDLVLPATPEELACLEPDPARRVVLLRAALLILRADTRITDTERTWLGRLGSALGLDEVRQRELEQDLLLAADGAAAGP